MIIMVPGMHWVRNALRLYMIGDCTASEQRCDLGVVKAAITVGGHANLRFRDASVRTHC